MKTKNYVDNYIKDIDNLKDVDIDKLNKLRKGDIMNKYKIIVLDIYKIKISYELATKTSTLELIEKYTKDKNVVIK